MSNRNKWAHRKAGKPKKYPYMKWFVGIPCLVLGVLLVWSAVQGFRDNTLWYWQFNPRFGRFVPVPTASLLLFGGIFIVCGVISMLGKE